MIHTKFQKDYISKLCLSFMLCKSIVLDVYSGQIDIFYEKPLRLHAFHDCVVFSSESILEVHSKFLT